MITKEQYWVNPNAKGKLSWEHNSYCTSDSEEELEIFQNRLHEVSTRRCLRVTKAVCCMIYEVCNLPSYDGLGDVYNFLNYYEEKFSENQRFSTLDRALKATPSRWWNAHKKNTGGWKECQRLMWIRFGQREIDMEINYDGKNNLRMHIHLCTLAWKEIMATWIHSYIRYNT